MRRSTAAPASTLSMGDALKFSMSRCRLTSLPGGPELPGVYCPRKRRPPRSGVSVGERRRAGASCRTLNSASHHRSHTQQPRFTLRPDAPSSSSPMAFAAAIPSPALFMPTSRLARTLRSDCANREPERAIPRTWSHREWMLLEGDASPCPPGVVMALRAEAQPRETPRPAPPVPALSAPPSLCGVSAEGMPPSPPPPGDAARTGDAAVVSAIRLLLRRTRLARCISS